MARRALLLRVGGLLLCLGLPIAAWLSGQGTRLAAAAPALGYGAAALTFARTLRRGREPLIATACRLDFGRVPDECRGYARRLTWLWALLTGALAIEAIALPVLGATAWLGAVSLTNAALIIGLFVGEHWVRAQVFPHLPPGSPLRTGRIMLQTLRHL